jgi:hypothetical protein
VDIVKATRQFEAWLARSIRLVPADLRYKHQQMRADPFLYFRATYYRWCQLWLQECSALAGGAETLAVGDLHLENFGTWRDTEGRLIWGVNDFDEAHPMSFANDLVRLAVSAFLAADAGTAFVMDPKAICDQILHGYREQLDKGGEPYVLMEKHPDLRQMALQDLREPAPFWQRLMEKTTALPAKGISKPVQSAIAAISSHADLEFRVLLTPKGLGSLGRQRFLAVGREKGGMMAREAKAVAPSALLWATGRKATRGNPFLEKTVRAAVRCQDPYYEVRRHWLVRRLSPDCNRIDISELRHHRDHALLLFCMGAETANIHLGAKKARKRIIRSIAQWPRNWLQHAAHQMRKRSLEDWEKFRRARASH